FGFSKKPSRIGQWDGRRRSSRSDEPVLPQLWQRPVLLRLGAVLLTALAATVLSCTRGPTHSFRVGQICPHDLRARVYFEIVDQARTDRRREQAVENLPEKQRNDPMACEMARRAVPSAVDRYPPGALLVPRGQPITDQQFNLLRLETSAFVDSQKRADHFRRGASQFLVFSLLASLVILYVSRFQQGLSQSMPKVVGVCGVVLATLTLGLLLSHLSWHAILIPLTVTAL